MWPKKMAWPELIVLIIASALLVLAAEVLIEYAVVRSGAGGGLILLVLLMALLADLWAVLRLVDWLFAGPARRGKWRIVRFSR